MISSIVEKVGLASQDGLTSIEEADSGDMGELSEYFMLQSDVDDCSRSADELVGRTIGNDMCPLLLVLLVAIGLTKSSPGKRPGLGTKDILNIIEQAESGWSSIGVTTGCVRLDSRTAFTIIEIADSRGLSVCETTSSAEFGTQSVFTVIEAADTSRFSVGDTICSVDSIEVCPMLLSTEVLAIICMILSLLGLKGLGSREDDVLTLIDGSDSGELSVAEKTLRVEVS
jgi:hypothetical protein